jgi:8-oxo-dGTP pyrophosphatase MutT (NUDIX family)
MLIKKRVFNLFLIGSLALIGTHAVNFCAVPPQVQDITIIAAIPTQGFDQVVYNLRTALIQRLGVREEKRGSAKAPYMVPIIRGKSGSESNFNMTHQEYRNGIWEKVTNEPHITLRSVPNDATDFIRTQFFINNSPLTVPSQFKIVGFEVLRGENHKDRAYLSLCVKSCDNNSFEQLAGQIDARIPSLSRDFPFMPHISLATIIPNPMPPDYKQRHVIEDSDIAIWQQIINDLWKNELSKQYGQQCYSIDYIKIKYWQPGSQKQAEEHGINMAQCKKDDVIWNRPTSYQQPQSAASSVPTARPINTSLQQGIINLQTNVINSLKMHGAKEIVALLEKFVRNIEPLNKKESVRSALEAINNCLQATTNTEIVIAVGNFFIVHFPGTPEAGARQTALTFLAEGIITDAQAASYIQKPEQLLAPKPATTASTSTMPAPSIYPQQFPVQSSLSHQPQPYQFPMSSSSTQPSHKPAPAICVMHDVAAPTYTQVQDIVPFKGIFGAAGILPYAQRQGKTVVLLGLVKQNRKKPSWGDFGGLREKGESAEMTAEREFREETGGQLGTVSISPRTPYFKSQREPLYIEYLAKVPYKSASLLKPTREVQAFTWIEIETLIKAIQTKKDSYTVTDYKGNLINLHTQFVITIKANKGSFDLLRNL